MTRARHIEVSARFLVHTLRGANVVAQPLPGDVVRAMGGARRRARLSPEAMQDLRESERPGAVEVGSRWLVRQVGRLGTAATRVSTQTAYGLLQRRQGVDGDHGALVAAGETLTGVLADTAVRRARLAHERLGDTAVDTAHSWQTCDRHGRILTFAGFAAMGLDHEDSRVWLAGAVGLAQAARSRFLQQSGMPQAKMALGTVKQCGELSRQLARINERLGDALWDACLLDARRLSPLVREANAAYVTALGALGTTLKTWGVKPWQEYRHSVAGGRDFGGTWTWDQDLWGLVDDIKRVAWKLAEIGNDGALTMWSGRYGTYYNRLQQALKESPAPALMRL